VRAGDSPYRATEAKDAVERRPRSLAPVTWAIVLGQLSLVFGLFVVANLGSFFGGHDLVRAAGTRTYAEHLHDGFAEVTAATLLSVAVVMFGHRVVATPRNSGQRRLLAALEIVLLALTAVTLGSCWQRMSIYLDAYGATHLRLFTIVWQVFALGLLLITLVRTVARQWRSHGAWLVAWPLVVAVGASALNADLVVARTNLDRLVDAPATATSTGLDEHYLAGLSLDALPALDEPHVPRDLAERLRTAWLWRAQSAKTTDWRSARGLGNEL
jgi:two-component system, OmpR family, sensor histidine kinase BaeS